MWIKVLGMNGDVRLVNLDNACEIQSDKCYDGRPCVYISFIDGGCRYDTTIEALENEIAEYYAQKTRLKRRSEENRQGG